MLDDFEVQQNWPSFAETNARLNTWVFDLGHINKALGLEFSVASGQALIARTFATPQCAT